MSSSVALPEDAYIEQEPKWKLCRDVLKGRSAIHGAGTQYLPKLGGQTTEEYQAYQQRAGWYGATDRTAQSLKGMVFRKEPDVKYEGPGLDEFIEDATLGGVSLAGVCNMVFDEVIATGRAGLLVDHQRSEEGRRLSVAEARQRNLRAYLQLYSAEQILGFRTELVNNKSTVVQVRLLETNEQLSDSDEFLKETIRQVRVLELVEGIYQQRVFRQTSAESEAAYAQVGEPIIPRRNGETFKHIPFYFIGVQDLEPGYDKPPLEDLAELNVDHYRTRADYKHGLHFTGLPTAVITGHKDDDEETEYRIGSATAWIFPDPEADAKYLEFTGGGLSELREELGSIKNDMATLGARMLATEKRAAEAAESHIIKRTGEHSLLAAIANNVAEGLTLACEEVREWTGAPGEISVHLNTDFLPVEMSTKEITELWGVTQAGGMLFDDYLFNLRQGERLDPNIDDDERKNRLETSPAPGLE